MEVNYSCSNLASDSSYYEDVAGSGGIESGEEQDRSKKVVGHESAPTSGCLNYTIVLSSLLRYQVVAGLGKLVNMLTSVDIVIFWHNVNTVIYLFIHSLLIIIVICMF